MDVIYEHLLGRVAQKPPLICIKVSGVQPCCSHCEPGSFSGLVLHVIVIVSVD